MLGLQLISQDAKQQMAGQVGLWSPPKHGVPTTTKLTDVDVAQTRDLDVECLPVR